VLYYNPHIKRLVDLTLAAFAFILFSPLLYFIIIFIKLDSTGSTFFRQKRVGRDFRPFQLLKFRSMAVPDDLKQGQFEPGDSSRITRVGSFLRKTKLDELPELYNVFNGDMSIVGPRPEVPKYRHVYTGEFAPVLSLRPGITDLASIKYRNEELLLRQGSDPEKMYSEVILPDKLRLCLKYKEIISFKTDLKIIFSTLRRVLE